MFSKDLTGRQARSASLENLKVPTYFYLRLSFRLARYGCLYSTRLSIYNVDGVKPASSTRPTRPWRFPHLSVLPVNGASKRVMGKPFILILCLKDESGVPTRGKVFKVDLQGAVAIVHAPVFPRIGFERDSSSCSSAATVGQRARESPSALLASVVCVRKHRSTGQQPSNRFVQLSCCMLGQYLFWSFRFYSSLALLRKDH